MNNISVKKLVIIFVSFIFVQFVIIIFTDKVKSVGYESGKAFEEFEKENPGVINKVRNSTDEKLKDELTTELAKKIYLEELLRLQKDYNVREYIASNIDSKNDILNSIEKEIEQIKSKNPDSYKLIELEHSIKIIKTGYNPITYTMEKIFGFNSLDFLIYQKNYFFMILTSILFLILIMVKLLLKYV